MKGKVIIVTGGGGGIGRGIALVAAAGSASVVANNLRVSPAGGTTDDDPATKVLERIRAAGGQAVANRDNVVTWNSAQRVIECVIESFGRIGGIVNNAGVLRDALFHKFGQILRVRNNELYLFGRSRPVRIMHDGNGWPTGTMIDWVFSAISRIFCRRFGLAMYSRVIQFDGSRQR